VPPRQAAGPLRRVAGLRLPAEPSYQQTGSSDSRYYLNRDIAAIAYSYPGGPQTTAARRRRALPYRTAAGRTR
jgi:hypothetical protein